MDGPVNHCKYELHFPFKKIYKNKNVFMEKIFAQGLNVNYMQKYTRYINNMV